MKRKKKREKQRKPHSPVPANPQHKREFEQLLEDAIFGVKKKKR